MDKGFITSIIELYADKVKDYYDLKSIILYGSYANGNPREDSDIDVAVIVKNFIKDYLFEEANLNKLANEVDFRIEPVLFKEDDKDPTGFLEEIRKNGIVIFNA